MSKTLPYDSPLQNSYYAYMNFHPGIYHLFCPVLPKILKEDFDIILSVDIVDEKKVKQDVKNLLKSLVHMFMNYDSEGQFVCKLQCPTGSSFNGKDGKTEVGFQITVIMRTILYNV